MRQGKVGIYPYIEVGLGLVGPGKVGSGIRHPTTKLESDANFVNGERKSESLEQWFLLTPRGLGNLLLIYFRNSQILSLRPVRNIIRWKSYST